MQRYALPLALLALAPTGALAATVDETSVTSVVVVRVDEADRPPEFSRLLDGFLTDGRRTVVTGDAKVLQRLRPSYAYVWPSNDTIVLDPAFGLGVFGFDASDEEARRRVLSLWPWNEDPLSADTEGRARRDTPAGISKQVRFDIVATSPAEVCRGFTREMTDATFRDTAPTNAQRAAFRKELRRWCQHGHLSVHLAEPAQFSVDGFASSESARLTLASEWALIRSEDAETGTKYYFWNKTLGDGAGNGFTLGRNSEGHADDDGGIDDVMDVAIHSGWGSVMPGDDAFTWPAGSTFPLVGNVNVFRCDGPDATFLTDCPVMPVVRKLYPTDSVDGVVNRARGESFSFGGDASVSASVVENQVGVSTAFGLSAVATTATVSHSDATLTSVRSSADRVFSRSTWWHPDAPAILQWIKARNHTGSLAKATPLAATLNPRYEILWELPANGNAGRTLPYHVFYEMGVNTCTQGCLCRLQGKPRVGWVDHVLVRIPAD